MDKSLTKTASDRASFQRGGLRILEAVAVIISAAHSTISAPLFEKLLLILLSAAIVLLVEILLRKDALERIGSERKSLEETLRQERQKSELQIRSVEERFEKAFRLGPAPMALSRLSDGKFVDMNDMYLDYFGYTRDQMIGHNSRELNIITDDQRAALVEELKAKGFARNINFDTQTRWGEPRHALFSSETMDIGGETHMLSILFDITELRAAEKKLRSREAELAEAQKIAKIGDWSIDLKAKYGNWSSSFARIHGKPDEWLGGPMSEYLSIVPEEDRPIVEGSIQTAAQSGKFVSFDHRIKISETETRWLHVRMDSVKDSSQEESRMI